MWLLLWIVFVLQGYRVLCTEATFEIFNGKVIHFDIFLDQCVEYKNKDMEMGYENVTGNAVNGVITFNYDIFYIKPQGMDIGLMVDIQRCASIEALDTCMKFMTFKTNSLCNFLKSDTDVWSPMMMCGKPRALCPFQGVTRGRNCSMDLSKFNWFPIGTSYWKLKVEVFTGKKNKKIIGCTSAEGGTYNKKNYQPNK